MIDPRRPTRMHRIMEDQAVLLAWLIRDLIVTVDREPEINFHKFVELSAYQRFMTGVSACGFYCRDGSGMPNFSEVMGQPHQFLIISNVSDARKFIYSVMENEKFNNGASSAVLYCVKTGALGILADRLEDGSLREPPFIPATSSSRHPADNWDMLQGCPYPEP